MRGGSVENPGQTAPITHSEDMHFLRFANLVCVTFISLNWPVTSSSLGTEAEITFFFLPSPLPTLVCPRGPPAKSNTQPWLMRGPASRMLSVRQRQSTGARCWLMFEPLVQAALPLYWLVTRLISGGAAPSRYSSNLFFPAGQTDSEARWSSLQNGLQGTSFSLKCDILNVIAWD